MNDLIKITSERIGAENVNSVNARDLHEALEVKKAFSTWIKTALENAGAIEGEDFCKLKSSLEGSGYQFDYIVTADMSKHIAMMSKVPKSKEIRDYFIQAEKQSQKILTPQEQIMILAQGSVEQEKRLSIIEHKVDNEILLTSAQKHHLRNLVSKKVYELKEVHNFDDSFVRTGFQRVWKILKKHFVVSSYMEIPKVKFEEAVSLVDGAGMGDLL